MTFCEWGERAMKKTLIAAVSGFLLFHAAFADGQSLTHLYALGKTILDLDGDGLGDKPALTIIIPDNPSAFELALAADISARTNLESLALDFGLVRRASEVGNLQSLTFPVFIGAGLPWVREALKERHPGLESLGPNQGLVFVISRKNRPGIACVAGSDEALLQTGRAFFLRWPYFWEIWGRETGATYFSLEKDIAGFLSPEQVRLEKTVVREALYEFPVRPAAANALQGLSFNQGQIRNLTVEVHFSSGGDREKAEKALLALKREQQKGLRTEVLSYPGCGRVTLELWFGEIHTEVALPRTGSTKRLLTPAYRERPGADPPGKEFDLLGLFSAKGFYADQDRDGILDSLDSSVIIPKGPAAVGVAELAARLMLATAGASFPLVSLDSEVESRRALAAPVLVGSNTLTKDLIRTGKLEPPALESSWGLARVVPKAFGKSGALVLYAPESAGLEKTLSYFARTFPFFDDYGEGRPQVRDVAADFEKFLKGEKGAAEAFFIGQLEKTAEEFKGRDIESFDCQVLLPRPNKKFEEAVRTLLAGAVRAPSLTVSGSTLRTGWTVFEKEKEFSWEADDALALIKEKSRGLDLKAAGQAPLKVSLGLSESPQVRQKLRSEIIGALAAAGVSNAEVEVLSAYKQGFFWLTERVLPEVRGKNVHHLSVRFSEAKEDLTRPKRTYSEPSRWLQELYPVDEILARELAVPLDRITFEIKEPGGFVYEVQAFDEKNTVLFEGRFTPRTKDIPLLSLLPEWGTARLTCGWLRMEAGKNLLVDMDLQTDLEKFWAFYQSEVLTSVYSHIMKKTAQEPTFSKQPYFKRLLVELWASEPDFRLGLDEEVCSSLEALHDEIYFDTLDLLRGITRFDPDDKELPPDTSRSSAPGNVLPYIHPSLEGGPSRVKITFEDWPGQAPEVALKWKEKGREEVSKKIAFPSLKPKDLRLAGFVYNGRDERVEDLFIEADIEKEAEYLALLDILDAYRKLGEKGLVDDPFGYPRLHELKVRLRFQDQEKEETVPVVPRPAEGMDGNGGAAPKPGEDIVTTREIISPAMCRDIVRRLGRFPVIRSYVGGQSYEGRDVPVLEMYLPLEKYVSIPRLVTFKPTLLLSARQHANEVSSTNYLLKFAELVARDRTTQEALKKMNFVLQPMENPDGAELAYGLQKLEPFHSLHAGRYSSLGVDIGYQLGSKPLLPEAAVRPALYNRWLPDIYLNLHGYPSHEWVQQFSNYTPYLFRDYWVPKGWFTYYKSLSLPVYEKWKEAGEELMGFIIRELGADEKIRESNRKFYDRYSRWAGRWAPHMDALEIYDGVNIFAKRKAPTENKMSSRSQATFVEQTPEVMDETATGSWLNFLCDQGLAYLRAHVKYLVQAGFDIVRLEEESQDRVRIAFVRGRPAAVKRTK
jgi:hypothetical protein